jgi:hypothetical protein
MKTDLALLNSLGFQNDAQRVAYAAFVLDAATTSNALLNISPAVAASPAVVAQTAKPARPASVVVTGSANTAGYVFGELYLNSPAYPIGADIPAIPAKPASTAVVARPAVLASAAVVAPAVAALKGWDMAIDTDITASSYKIEAYLPVASNVNLVGAIPDAVSAIKEITPSALIVKQWIGSKASITPTTTPAEPATLEQYFYKYAKQIVAEPDSTSTIEDIIYTVAGVPTVCKHIILNLVANSYNVNSPLLQLDKLSTEEPFAPE